MARALELSACISRLTRRCSIELGIIHRALPNRTAHVSSYSPPDSTPDLKVRTTSPWSSPGLCDGKCHDAATGLGWLRLDACVCANNLTTPDRRRAAWTLIAATVCSP
jgi:hypothetical protein